MRNAERFFLSIVSCIARIGEKSGFFSFLRKKEQESLIVLMYHGITDKNSSILNFDHKHVEVGRFEKQLHYLKQHYNIISWREFLDWKQARKKIPHNPVLITFDDGYANLWTVALPSLKKYVVPAVVFLPTKYIGKKEHPWYDTLSFCIGGTEVKNITVSGKVYSLESGKQKIAAINDVKKRIRDQKINNPKILQEALDEIREQTKMNTKEEKDPDFSFLTWEQCQKMKKENVSFGSHSVNHEMLTFLSEKEKEKEIIESKIMIEKMLKESCVSFAYPFGDVDEECQELLRKNEYVVGFSTIYGKNTNQINQYMIRRIAINNLYDPPIFSLNLFFNFGKFHDLLIKKYSKLKDIL